MTKRPLATVTVFAATIALAATATLPAATTTNNGYVLEFPSYPITGEPLAHCEPWNDLSADNVTLSGVPVGSMVTLQFMFSSGIPNTPLVYPAPINLTNVGGDPFSVDIPYPQDTLTWPYQAGPVRSIIVAVAVHVTSGTNKTKFSSKQWKVTCIPKVPEDKFKEGCTLGYWKTHTESWSAYAPGDSFDAVFGVVSALDPPGNAPVLVNPTLLDVLELGGGDGQSGENGMARQAVAALLNSVHPDVNFPMISSAVLGLVQDAYAGEISFAAAHAMFEENNEIVTILPDGTRYHCGLN